VVATISPVTAVRRGRIDGLGWAQALTGDTAVSPRAVGVLVAFVIRGLGAGCFALAVVADKAVSAVAVVHALVVALATSGHAVSVDTALTIRALVIPLARGSS